MKNAACLAVFLGVAATAQEVPVVLQVDVENTVRYVGDVIDPSRVAQSPAPVPPSSTRALNFGSSTVIGDVVAVNGNRANGAWAYVEHNVRLTPTPTIPMPGGAISDVMQPSVAIHSLEFVTPDGGLIGTILSLGAVGSPSKGWAIVGGIGAFLGATGSISATANPGIRTTSQSEDPSMRRVNGGGRGTYIIQLFPMFRPEVLVGANGPVIIHADYSAVTADKPARPGEVLILYAKGLGPTTPSVNTGDPYPGAPFAIVNSPVEVLVNGKSSPAINQIGLPGTSDVYHVAFRVPDDTTVGSTRVQISAAWVKGSTVAMPVR